MASAPERRQRTGRRHRLRTRLRGERGVSTLELAMFTPLLILLLSLTLQFAMIWYARQVATAAAREGARVARSEQGTAAAAGDRARTYADQIGSDILLGVSVTPSRDEVTGVASVEVSGNAVRLLWTQQITARSEGPIEVFRPADG